MHSDQSAFSDGCSEAPGALRFRGAQAGDAEVCASLMFASGVQEFGFFLGESADRCIAFLRFAFKSTHGRFSYRRHHVAVTGDGRVVAMLAAHDGRKTGGDDLHVALMLWRFFGLRRATAMLLRGLVLEEELPAPKKSQTLVAHCATLEPARGQRVFSALFHDTLCTGRMKAEGDRQIVLDVLVGNTRAYDLYKRLGFVALPRRHAISHRLPSALESVRMELRRKI